VDDYVSVEPSGHFFKECRTGMLGRRVQLLSTYTVTFPTAVCELRWVSACVLLITMRMFWMTDPLVRAAQWGAGPWAAQMFSFPSPKPRPEAQSEHNITGRFWGLLGAPQGQAMPWPATILL
jgi:hypothetical protein